MKPVNIDTKWIDSGREPTQPPNPRYPDGIDIDLRDGAGEFCATALKHPTARCGYWSIRCLNCGFRALVTTAGRPDDPRTVKLPCKERS